MFFPPNTSVENNIRISIFRLRWCPGTILGGLPNRGLVFHMNKSYCTFSLIYIYELSIDDMKFSKTAGIKSYTICHSTSIIVNYQYGESNMTIWMQPGVALMLYATRVPTLDGDVTMGPSMLKYTGNMFGYRIKQIDIYWVLYHFFIKHHVNSLQTGAAVEAQK